MSALKSPSLQPAALASLALLSACGAPPGTELFPLEAGHQWTYAQHTEWETGATDDELLTLRNLGPDRSLPDGSAWRRHSDSGADYWLRADATGIYRVASQSELDGEPHPDTVPRYVLKHPIAPGTSWQASTTAYLLQRRQEFPRELRHAHPDIPMNYVIEAIGQTVRTRAGEFVGCVKVVGQAKLRLFADPVGGWRDLPLTTTEWYCPGPGLVLLTREEPANSTFLTGGKLTLELSTWQ